MFQYVGQRIQQARRRWEFETVADGPIDASTKRRDRKLAFRMISDDGISVVDATGGPGHQNCGVSWSN
ncbi:hypothetical protein [Salinispora arenicola]|uniref:hypothetical protein n=1 Tax=Salinispora arenicola TaxID=168697 RepID=UPI0027DC0F13|nr:hypothetical protein [Salinispora arenicola]